VAGCVVCWVFSQRGCHRGNRLAQGSLDSPTVCAAKLAGTGVVLVAHLAGDDLHALCVGGAVLAGPDVVLEATWLSMTSMYSAWVALAPRAAQYLSAAMPSSMDSTSSSAIRSPIVA